MTGDLHDVSDREMVQLLAAQRTLFDNQPDGKSETFVSKEELKAQYKSHIKEYAEKYDVEVSV